jgi:hypothetical protein
MNAYTKTSSHKLVDRFDNELRTLLLNDIPNVRGIKTQFLHSKTRARVQSRIAVA